LSQPSESRGPILMPRRGYHHMRDWTVLGWVLWAPVVLGLLIGLSLPLVQRMRATASAAPAAPVPAPIDGGRAYGYLKRICALGPRPAGSAANDRQRALVAGHFRAAGGEVREQPFAGVDPLDGRPVKMANLIGSWFPDRTERILLAAHYDTRPFPDRDPDPVKRRGPFLGANDGASGVAVLMEIANHLADSPTPCGVDLVLLDGEELVYEGAGADDMDFYFLGSKHFGRAYAADRRAGRSPSRYVAGILLDMVGDKNLVIDQEINSLRLQRKLVQEVWTVANRLKERVFRAQVGPEVHDDHLPLNDAGIPTIDLIDFDYPAWHTAADRPEACSAASLASVGRVVTAWLNLPRPARR